jgi:tetratricopeptide (TPR) repeat protein
VLIQSKKPFIVSTIERFFFEEMNMSRVFFAEVLFCFVLFVGVANAVPISSQQTGEWHGYGSQPVGESHEYEQFYKKGLQALEAGNLDAASKYFDESLAVYEDFVPAQLGKIHVEFSRNNEAKAKARLLTLKDKFPNDEHVLVTYARYMASKSEFQKAVAAFEQALEVAPENIVNYINLADLYMNSPVGTPAMAAGLYRRALSINENHAGASYALGVALQKQGENGEAKKHYLHSAQLSDSNPLPLLAVAKLSLIQKVYGDAEGFYRQALSRDSSLIEAKLGLADIASARGDVDSAIKQYLKVSEKHSSDHRAFMRLGMEYQAQGRWAKSVAAYKQVVQHAPGVALAYNNLAWISVEYLGDKSAALTWSQKAVSLSPNIAPFQDTLGWVYRSLGDLAEAKTAFQAAVSLDANYFAAQYHLGLVLVESGAKDEGVTWLKKAEMGGDVEAAELAKETLSGL